MARNPQKYHKTILRFNAKKRVNLSPKVCSYLIEKLLRGIESYSLSDIELSMDHVDFSDKLYNDIISIKEESDLNTSAAVGDIFCSQFGEPNELSWESCYMFPIFNEDFRFAMLFTSDTRLDWMNSTIQVIKSSLDGQLKNENSCFFSLRLNEISDEEYGAFNMRSDFETDRINPFDMLSYELYKKNLYDRICGMSFFCRPRYKTTSVFNSSGSIITMGNHPMYTVLNPNHPMTSGFGQILGCSRKKHG